MPGWHGSLRLGALLGARADAAGARGPFDAGERREGLRQAQQERRSGRRGDLRGGSPADDAICAGEVGRAAGPADAAPGARSSAAARTQVINALRAHLAELGIVAAQGREGLKQLLAIIAEESDERVPIDARASLIVLAAQLQALQTMIGSIERRLTVQHRANEASKRLESVPGIGIIGASAIAATVTDPNAFRLGAILPPGLGSSRAKIRPGANRSLGRFPSRATAICGVFLWSGHIPCCGGPGRTRRNILG